LTRVNTVWREESGWVSVRGIRWLQWQASPQAVGFYERLGLKADTRPQPEYPYFKLFFLMKDNERCQRVQSLVPLAVCSKNILVGVGYLGADTFEHAPRFRCLR
jgi:hypothetical protein